MLETTSLMYAYNVRTYVDKWRHRKIFVQLHLLSWHRPGLGTLELHGDMLFTVWLSVS